MNGTLAPFIRTRSTAMCGCAPSLPPTPRALAKRKKTASRTESPRRTGTPTSPDAWNVSICQFSLRFKS